MTSKQPQSDGGKTGELDFLTEFGEYDQTRSDRYRSMFSKSSKIFWLIWSDWRTRVGILIIAFYLFMGTIGVAIIDPPSQAAADRYVTPFTSLEYPLGSDRYGQGLLALTVHATPHMLKMISAGAIFATVMAGIVGTLSGLKRGYFAQALMAITDIMIALPGLPLIMVIAAMFEPQNPYLIGVILTINAWAGVARSLRSEVLKIREESFVEASHLMGLPSRKIITYDILPNIMPYMLVSLVSNARSVIYGSVALYFLGVLPFSALNWGVTLNIAYQQSTAIRNWDVAHWIIVPLFTIILLSLGLILVAQGADRLFNPKVRAKEKADSAITSQE